MSENTNKEFDSALRALLKDAQEEVPSRVWENISARTTVSGSRTVKRALPFAFVAAAASLALVLFLRPVNKPASVAPSPVQICEVQADVAPEYVALAPEQAAPARRLVASASAAPAPVIPVSPAQEESKLESVPSESRSAEKDSGASASQGQTDDPFARMELEDRSSEQMKKFQFSFKASMAGSEGGSSTPAKAVSGIQVSGKGQSLSETSVSTFGVPFTVGLGAHIELLPRFSVGTGLEYSLLFRTFSADYRKGEFARSGDVRHSMHYLGIPLTLSYEFVKRESLSVYVAGGGRIEWCFSNDYEFRAGDFSTTLHNSVNYPQASVSLGLGAEYRFSEHFALYLEPDVRYFFYCSQPKNLRTERPFLFDLNLGLRFRL